MSKSEQSGVSLVTGAAGFIGSTLCEKLLEQGKVVAGIDSFTDYYPEQLKRQSVEKCMQHDDFNLVEDNINTTDLDVLLNGVEHVYHLAAQAGVRKSWGENFQVYIDQNITATQRLLEHLKTKSIKKLVYASSSSVYGDTPDLPMKETSVLKPVSPYGVTKLAAENLCHLYEKAYSIPLVSLRFFTVYGPRQRPDMAFNRFIQRALKGDAIEIYGDGEQTRDFTYVDDIVNALIKAAETGESGNIYNIGGGNRISLNELLKTLEKIGEVKLKIKHVKTLKGEMRHTFADCTKAKQELGYRPEYNLEQGLMNEWNWLKNQKT